MILSILGQVTRSREQGWELMVERIRLMDNKSLSINSIKGIAIEMQPILLHRAAVSCILVLDDDVAHWH